MLELVQRLCRLRQAHPVLRRRRFFHGRRVHGLDVRDIVWLKPDGGEMGERDWFAHYVRSLGMLLNGQVMHEWSELGEIVYDDPLLVLLNAYWEPLSFVLPRLGPSSSWRLLVDTARPELPEQAISDGHYPVGERSLVVLTLPREGVA